MEIKKLYSFFDGEILTFQRMPYIEDGWYIECNKNNNWKVFEIPAYGEEPHFVSHHRNFIDAYKTATSLT